MLGANQAKRQALGVWLGTTLGNACLTEKHSLMGWIFVTIF